MIGKEKQFRIRIDIFQPFQTEWLKHTVNSLTVLACIQWMESYVVICRESSIMEEGLLFTEHFKM
jgi:hypothetical protein